MILDLTSFAFGYELESGSGTPNWGTSLGQGKEYKINTNLSVNDILQGIIYKSVPLSNISAKLGKGGKECRGNLADSPIILGAVFDKVYINNTLIKDGKFVLLLTRDTSESHNGRLRIKYGLSNSYYTDEKRIDNEQFLLNAKSQLNLANDACWFIYEIVIRNQDELILKSIIVNDKGKEKYASVKEQHLEWETLVKKVKGGNVDLFDNFKLWLSINKNYTDTTVESYINALKQIDTKCITDIQDSIFRIDSIYLFDKLIAAFKSSDSFADYDKKYKKHGPASIACYREFLSTLKLSKPHQRIFFGAPGTGKSYKLNQEAKQYFGDNFKRVTFHPNYMYGNFVGQYKPYPAEGNSEKITYKFVPGILINQLVEALKNPDKNYLVIIEEINRANVAAVFGDLFQLLDRNSNGESEYSIAITKELQDYFKNEAFLDELLNENIQKKLGDDFSTLYLPNNLYIWATMNSADQGVMPMDTAFKRRWDFTYLGVNDAVDDNSDEFESYIFSGGDGLYKWNDYREQINDRLSKLNIPEDKLLGPYFLSKNVLSNEDKSYISEVLKDKVLMYLYEDAARAFRGKLFKEGTFGTYSQLCKAFDENPLSIFKEEIDINPINTNNAQDLTDGN